MRDIKEDTKYFQSFDQEWSVGHKSMGIPKSPALVDRQNLTTIARILNIFTTKNGLLGIKDWEIQKIYHLQTV